MGHAVVWLGIDVAKDAIDVAYAGDGSVARIARRTVCLQEWAATVPPNAWAVLEATGGYERAVATALRARGVSVCIVNPRQVRASAR